MPFTTCFVQSLLHWLGLFSFGMTQASSIASPYSAAPYPVGKEFAFTILDDTDDATVANVRPIYELLADLGFRTTKTVWPLACPEGSPNFFAAETLADPSYREFVRDLKAQGFEITWHGATMESSDRARTSAGLEQFRSEFGAYPIIHPNHATNRENIYWGWKRYNTLPVRTLARIADRHPSFEGDEETSRFFWGDLCRRHLRYVRNFTFYEVNTLRADAEMPYTLRDTKYVNRWFSTSDAADVSEFLTLFNTDRIDRLREEGGVCILSTHLGKGYVRNGLVDPGVRKLLEYIAAQPAWLVPTGEILSHLESRRPRSERNRLSLLRLEASHVADRVLGPARWK